jgi:hypothetical protein
MVVSRSVLKSKKRMLLVTQTPTAGALATEQSATGGIRHGGEYHW